MDIDLPQMNGLDLLRKIKQEDVGVQVIMLTGLVSQSTVLQSMQLGAEICVFKLITDFELLLSALKTAFHKIERWWDVLEELQELRRDGKAHFGR